MRYTWYATEFAPPELASPDYAPRKARYFDGSNWPTAFFDGVMGEPIAEVDSFYPKYRAAIAGARADSALVTIVLDSVRALGDTALGVAVRVAATDTTLAGRRGLMLAALVFEDSAPYFSRLIEETLHVRYCVRGIAGGPWGVPVQPQFGDDLDTMLVVRLGSWNRQRLGVAVFVQDTATLSVLQSAGLRRIW